MYMYMYNNSHDFHKKLNCSMNTGSLAKINCLKQSSLHAYNEATRSINAVNSLCSQYNQVISIVNFKYMCIYKY